MFLLAVPAIILIILITIIMENTKASAKDFFLHLGAIVALYTISISFLNLLFKIINKAFPEVAQNIYAWGGGSEISLPVATLIIVFPLFVFLSYLVYKIYDLNPEKKELGIRRWLTYITLFVAGIILAGDLVTVLYKFLDGQDLTWAFSLKALAVILVTGCVFGFYLQDIRDRVSPRNRKIWAWGVGAIILISVVLGFSIIGSPKTQRLTRLDNQKISELQNIQYQVINYWVTNGIIPETMPNIAIDSQTGSPYEYKKTGAMNYELCAVFNTESKVTQPISNPYAVTIGKTGNEDWSHNVGRQCFQRVIDPIAYPTQVKG